MLDRKTKNVIQKQIFSVYRKNQVRAVVLMGSRARGDFNKNSDYDIEVYLKKKKLRFNSKQPSLPERNIFINYTDSRNFNELKRKGHSFLYCSFRDGIPLHQDNNWFDRNKREILKLKPSKEIISFYLEASIERIMSLLKKQGPFYLDYEEGKSAANQLGFAILMDNNVYPISPHTLKKELIILNKKYKKIAESINYIQDIWYKDKRPNKRKCLKNLNILKNFAMNYVRINFPKSMEKIKEHEKFLKRIC